MAALIILTDIHETTATVPVVLTRKAPTFFTSPCFAGTEEVILMKTAIPCALTLKPALLMCCGHVPRYLVHFDERPQSCADVRSGAEL